MVDLAARRRVGWKRGNGSVARAFINASEGERGVSITILLATVGS